MKKLIVIVLILGFFAAGCQKKGSVAGSSEPTVVGMTSSSAESVSPAQDLQVEKVGEPLSSPETVASENLPSVKNLSWDELKQLSIEHQVLSGESLGKIAARYDVGVGLVSQLNGIENPNLVRIGQRLKVIQGPFQIVIHKKEKTLSVYLGEKHVKTYDIAVGKNDSTPEGEFKIMTKMVKPVWTDPYYRDMVKGDDPRYPLGTRWMQFADYGYGIHGTNDPNSIKTEASFGCIRMLDADVEELYDWVTIGTKVVILS